MPGSSRSRDDGACNDSVGLMAIVIALGVGLLLIAGGIVGIVLTAEDPTVKATCVVTHLGWDSTDPKCIDYWPKGNESSANNCSCSAAHVAYYVGADDSDDAADDEGVEVGSEHAAGLKAAKPEVVRRFAELKQHERREAGGNSTLPAGWKFGVVPGPISLEDCKLPSGGVQVAGPSGIMMLWNTTCYHSKDDSGRLSFRLTQPEFDAAVASVSFGVFLFFATAGIVAFLRIKAGRSAWIPLSGEANEFSRGEISHSNRDNLIWGCSIIVAVLFLLGGIAVAILFFVTSARFDAYQGMGPLGFRPVRNLENCFLEYSPVSDSNVTENLWVWSPECSLENLPENRWTLADFKEVNGTKLATSMSSWAELSVMTERISLFSGMVALLSVILGLITLAGSICYRSWRVAAARVGWHNLSDRWSTVD